MVLQPRKFKYKSKHKLRKFSHSSNLRNNLHVMSYGQIGLLLTQPLRLSSRNIFRIRIFLNKSAKRSDDTRRKMWLNTFPHWPLTRKPIGSRMGKGTGKLKTWLSYLPSGTILFEFKNLRIGRALFFTLQLRLRLRSSSKLIWKDLNFQKLPFRFSRSRVIYQSFW